MILYLFTSMAYKALHNWPKKKRELIKNNKLNDDVDSDLESDSELD